MLGGFSRNCCWEVKCRAGFFALTGASAQVRVLAALSTPAVVGARDAVLQPVAGVLDVLSCGTTRCTVSHSIVWARGAAMC